MLNRSTRRTVISFALALVVALPSAAHAAAPAAATISVCGSDSVIVAGKVSLTGSSARRARGASLQMRFQALPLFGLPHSDVWKTVGKKTKASGQAAFPGLSADNWVGVMSWRFKKGSRTVLSGLARSEPLRIGRSKGRASCTIAEGVKPLDKTPPALFVLPSGDAWYRAPVSVQVIASDDFSGVQSVRYALDGGAKQAIANGSTFQLPDQGEHSVAAEATDVAGNTGTLGATVRVDAGPPTKPAFSRPFSVTSSTTPTFTWSASTDSGSGMGGYVLTIRKADGSVLAFKVVDAGTTSIPSPVTLNDGENYTAVVTAFDKTTGTPWSADSDALTFRVDSNADATSFSPANGTILSGNANTTNFTIGLDRVADKSTVTTSTVQLVRSDGTQPTYAVDCNTPCTQITVNPSSALAEGHYQLKLNGVKSADEGLTFSGSANYAVPFVDGDPISNATSNAITCGPAPNGTSMSSPSYNVSAQDPSQTAFLDFDLTYSGPGGWTMEAVYAGTAIASIAGGAGGHYRLNFPIGGHTGTNQLSFRLTAKCGAAATQVSAANLFGSRVP